MTVLTSCGGLFRGVKPGDPGKVAMPSLWPGKAAGSRVNGSRSVRSSFRRRQSPALECGRSPMRHQTTDHQGAPKPVGGLIYEALNLDNSTVGTD